MADQRHLVQPGEPWHHHRLSSQVLDKDLELVGAVGGWVCGCVGVWVWWVGGWVVVVVVL